MRRLFVLLILFTIGCQSREGGKPRALVFWCSNNGGEIQFAREFVERWQRTRPDKPLRYQPIPEGQSSEEIILASVVGKTTPDIYANMWQGSVELYAKAGVLVPLDTIADFRSFIRARCDSAMIREITSSDGHIYQVPWKVNPIMTLCNTGELTPNTTTGPPYDYSGYLRAGQHVQTRDANGYVNRWLGYTEVKAIWYQRLFNFYPLYLAASNGAPLLTQRPGQPPKAAFNNAAAVQVFRFLQTLYRNNYFARERLSATRDPFIDQRIVTQFTGPWQLSYLDKFGGADLRYAFYPMPVPDNHKGPIYTYGDPKNIVIFNTCPDPTAAWAFVKTLVDKPGDLRLMELTGQFPRRQQLDTDPYFTPFLAKNPRMAPLARQTRYIRGVDNSEVIVEVFDIISQEYEACVIFGKKTPEAAIADAARAVDVLLMTE
ncbi:carbohydrate ABC transporter substrate-binding protein (CUT1 family) [Spirosoma oryzae]|uniref:Carbohydrate ABC transporter substrate-binding protein (CUT1 family) n=1 Tax=Spirosoma oryzae TaxID=1469603 RepID=A0A2T0T8H0_9BACT|nr:extracellular solute-binding protein [Spirosoma oryzae]PRY41955.1 carbohydrate ABC transporter substrate-binding protein (CUT1 family) [Spirosoma oryzae]